MTDKTLQIGTHIYSGWSSLAISKRIDALSSSFSLSLVDNWSNGNDKWPFKPGDPAIIRDKTEPMVTGFIDELKVSVSKSQKGITLTGRDNTGDLVDSSAGIGAATEYLNQTLFQITKALVTPFKITVIDRVGDTTKFERWSVDPGESVFECLERAARKIGVLFRSDGKGNLVIEKIGQLRADTPLIEGENIKESEATFNLSNSFSSYITRAQSNEDGEVGTEIEGEVKDLSVKRFRPFVIISEGDVTKEKALTLAAWEASVRASRAIHANLVVQGWRQVSGKLWDVNLIVAVYFPKIGVTSDMLIVGVDFFYSKEGGTITKLELSRPDAYLPKAEVAKPNVEALSGD